MDQLIWVDVDAYGKRVFGSTEAVRRLSTRPGHVATCVAITDHDEALSAVSVPFRKKVAKARAGESEWVHAVGRIAGADRLTHQLVVFGENGQPTVRVNYAEKEDAR